jgi:hypothetical protein
MDPESRYQETPPGARALKWLDRRPLKAFYRREFGGD